MESITIPEPMEQATHDHFGAGVSAADTRHSLASS